MRTGAVLICLSVFAASVVIGAPLQGNTDAPVELGAGKTADVKAIESQVRQMRKASAPAKWKQVKAEESNKGAKTAVKAAEAKQAKAARGPHVSQKTIAADLRAVDAMAKKGSPAAASTSHAKPPAGKSTEKADEAKIRAMRKNSKRVSWNEVKSDESKWKTASAPKIHDASDELGAANTKSGSARAAYKKAKTEQKHHSGSARAAYTKAKKEEAQASRLKTHASTTGIARQEDPYRLSHLERAEMQARVNAQLVPKPYTMASATIRADESKDRASMESKPIAQVVAAYDKAMPEAEKRVDP